MPNTLAHMGIQALATRGILGAAGRTPFGWTDLNWVYLGCLIPDLPWILQRALKAAPVALSPIDLRLYSVVQSSLALSLVLCAALACVARRPGRVFAILALGSLFHLLLDPLQTKWANGVHLFAPFSWELLNFGLFWPEDWPTLALTALGLASFAYAWLRVPPAPLDLAWPKGRALALGALCLAVYLAAPPLLFDGPMAADNHSLRSLRDADSRVGRAVAFDRVAFDGSAITTLPGERLVLLGPDLGPPGTLSVQGVFETRDRVRLTAVHRHWPLVRDVFSYVALVLILLAWGRSARMSLRARP